MTSAQKNTTPDKTKTTTSLSNNVLIGLGIIVGFGILGHFLYPDTTSADTGENSSPKRVKLLTAAKTCEDLIKQNLKNPASYRQANRELFRDGACNLVHLGGQL